jgi:hypothetical protein
MVVRSLRRGERENFSAALPFCFARQLRRVPYLTAPRGAVNKSMHVAMRSSMMIEENKKANGFTDFRFVAAWTSVHADPFRGAPFW